MSGVQKPKYLNQISLGNWIQIGVIIISLATAFVLVQDQTSDNKEVIDELSANLDKAFEQVSTVQVALEIRIRQLENQQARADERFTSVLSWLSRIDSKLDRIERKQAVP